MVRGAVKRGANTSGTNHQDPVARGGETTMENVRLLCRMHNQHAAERAFGAEFMERKRAEARRAHKPARRA